MADFELPQDLIERFHEITHERVAKIVVGLELIQRGGGAPAIDALMREIHTLKGEARMMGANHVADLVHRTEDLVVRAADREFRIAEAESDLIVAGLDLVIAHLAESADVRLEGERTRFFRTVDEVAGPRTRRKAIVPAAKRAHAAPPADPIGRGLGDYLRVPGAALSSLTDLTGQLVIYHDTAARLIQTLWDEVRGDRDRDPELAETVRRLRDDAFDARLSVGHLQDSIQRMRLLDVSTLFERYPPAIRELAREHGKRVRVTVEGGSVAVDKQVLDLVDEALLHLVRNSVDHGIEAPADRRLAGKAEIGAITLSARQLGSRVEISVRDDGCGISAAAVRDVAVERGLITSDELPTLEDDAALRLVFRPGFSTRDAASETSGRGVGLDVVNDKVRALGGSVEVATTVGAGTAFTLTLPISVALIRVLCFRCGRVVLGLPSTSVRMVLRPPASAIERVADGLAISVPVAGTDEANRIPMLDLRRALGLERDAERDGVEVMVIEHGDTRLGLAIDSFIGERQLVQRSLGKFLAGIRLVSGIGLIERGEIVLLLSVPEIVWRWSEGDVDLARTLPLDTRRRTEWRVLVVDDSELTRDMLVGLARRAGLEVTEAVNGRDALAKARAAPPDLILTDLDMPVMDGFELIAALRAEPALRDVPVVVLTTRGSDEDKRRALSAGADSFVVKHEFDEDSLNHTIGHFLDTRAR